MSVFMLNKYLNKVNTKILDKTNIVGIIAAYLSNEEDIIEETIEHVLKINELSKLILVWNGPKPKNRNLIKKLEEKALNMGVTNFIIHNVIDSTSKSENINYAIKNYKANYYVIFDADSKPTPNSVNEGLKEFTSGDIGWVNILYKSTNSSNNMFCNFADSIECDYAFFYYKLCDFYSLPSHFRGHDIIISSNVFTFKGCDILFKKCLLEDGELSYRKLIKGFKGRSTNQILSTCDPMPDLKALYKQRKRWIMGTFELFANSILVDKSLPFILLNTFILLLTFTRPFLITELILIYLYPSETLRIIKGSFLSLLLLIQIPIYLPVYLFKGLPKWEVSSRIKKNE